LPENLQLHQRYFDPKRNLWEKFSYWNKISFHTRNINKDNENPKIPVAIICFILTDLNLTITNKCSELTANDGTKNANLKFFKNKFHFILRLIWLNSILPIKDIIITDTGKA
jgi:hypothetical protein